jgi:hypothetical protein
MSDVLVTSTFLDELVETRTVTPMMASTRKAAIDLFLYPRTGSLLAVLVSTDRRLSRSEASEYIDTN